jgi:hypothetical protein
MKQQSLMLPLLTSVLHGSIPGVSTSAIFHYYQSKINEKEHEKSH